MARPTLVAMSPAAASLVLFLAPAALLVAGAVAAGDRRPGAWRTRRATGWASWALLMAAPLSLAALLLVGSGTGGFAGPGGAGLTVRLDAVAVALHALVAMLGAVLLRFAGTYFEGDARQASFLGTLCAALASVLLLVTAGNLVQLIAMWVAASLFVHRLMLLPAARPLAREAARTKFVLARLSDAALLAGSVLLVKALGTTDLGSIAALLRAGDVGAQAEVAVSWAAVCLALAALLKSAQVPAHLWLPKTLDAPTPVSALLHAGIVNGGGVLVLRMADVMATSAVASALLLVVGGLTASVGAWVMVAQPTVKRRLAWSTIAQMGLMTFQLGLGAYAFALLHVIAHSLYKAHAFLASGELPAPARRRWTATPVHVVTAALALVGVIVALEALVGLGSSPATVALAAIVALGLAPVVAAADTAAGVARRGASLVLAAGLAASYVLAAALVTRLTSGVLPSVAAPGPWMWGAVIALLMALTLIAVTQVAAPTPRALRWRMHLRNGLYVDDLVHALGRRLGRGRTTLPTGATHR